MGDGITEALGGARVICKSEGFTLIVRVPDGETERARELAGKIAERMGWECWAVR